MGNFASKCCCCFKKHDKELDTYDPSYWDEFSLLMNKNKNDEKPLLLHDTF